MDPISFIFVCANKKPYMLLAYFLIPYKHSPVTRTIKLLYVNDATGHMDMAGGWWHIKISLDEYIKYIILCVLYEYIQYTSMYHRVYDYSMYVKYICTSTIQKF